MDGNQPQKRFPAALGQWIEMAALITDEMLATFAIVSTTTDLPTALLDRYRNLADRLSLYVPFNPDDERFSTHGIQQINQSVNQ
jgi:hypothetical protein